MLLCNNFCSESINKCVYDFFKILGKFCFIFFFLGVCLFLKKSEVILNVY